LVESKLGFGFGFELELEDGMLMKDAEMTDATREKWERWKTKK
jgi:hypothetical protein